MLFSAAVCPFFATASARAAVGDNRGMNRGHKAAVLGFRRVQMILGRDNLGDVKSVEFQYEGLCDQLWFLTADQVVAHLETAIARAPHIDTAERRYWDSEVTLEPAWHAGVRQFNRAQPLGQS